MPDMDLCVYVLKIEDSWTEEVAISVNRTQEGMMASLDEYIQDHWDEDDGEMPDDPEKREEIFFNSDDVNWDYFTMKVGP